MSKSLDRHMASFFAGAVYAYGISVLGLIGSSHAATLDDVNAVGWYGSGAKKTMLVVDFSTDIGASDSFAFGLNYDDTAGEPMTVYKLMTDIQADSSSGFSFGAEYFDAYKSYWVYSISYTASTGASYNASDDWPDLSLYLWTSGNVGETWTYSWSGASEVLANGEIAGWVSAVPNTSVDYTDPDYGSNYTAPVMPIPEPSAIALLATAALAALGWRLRRRK